MGLWLLELWTPTYLIRYCTRPPIGMRMHSALLNLMTCYNCSILQVTLIILSVMEAQPIEQHILIQSLDQNSIMKSPVSRTMSMSIPGNHWPTIICQTPRIQRQCILFLHHHHFLIDPVLYQQHQI